MGGTRGEGVLSMEEGEEDVVVLELMAKRKFEVFAKLAVATKQGALRSWQ